MNQQCPSTCLFSYLLASRSFLPPPPQIPVGCALLTFDGRAVISVNADTDVADPGVFLSDMIDYYRRLTRATDSSSETGVASPR